VVAVHRDRVVVQLTGATMTWNDADSLLEDDAPVSEVVDSEITTRPMAGAAPSADEGFPSIRRMSRALTTSMSTFDFGASSVFPQ
ncbi:hypothetical protein SARC_16397, partial [Sphaeroforma arctica JP610]